MNIADIANLLEPEWGETVLCAGSSMSDIEAVERKIGVRFPDSLRESYIISNGERPSKSLRRDRRYAGLLAGHNSLSLEELVSAVDFWRELLDSGDLAGNSEEYFCLPKKTIASGPYDSQWIPISNSSKEWHFAIDYAPAGEGSDMQIINFGSDEFIRTPLAASHEEFLEKIYLNALQGKGHWLFDGKLDDVDALLQFYSAVELSKS